MLEFLRSWIMELPDERAIGADTRECLRALRVVLKPPELKAEKSK